MAVIAKIEVNDNRVCDCARIDVTESDWHYQGMAQDRDEIDWQALGRAVAHDRTDRGWSKEEAGRRAGVSSITWKRVEDGKRVQDGKLGLILKAVGRRLDLTNPDGETVTLGTPGAPTPASGDEAAERLRQIAEQNIADLQADAEQQAAELARTDPIRAARMLQDVSAIAVELRRSVERAIATGSRFQTEVSEEPDTTSDAIAAHDEDGPIAGEQGHDENP